MPESPLQSTVIASEIDRPTQGGNGKPGVLSVQEDWQRDIRMSRSPHPESRGLTLEGG
jgi:hypothetical protein